MVEIPNDIRRGAIVHELARRILEWLGPKAQRWYRAGLFDITYIAGVWGLEWRPPIKALVTERRNRDG